MAASMKSVCFNILAKQLSCIKSGCKYPKRSYSSTQTSCKRLISLSSYSNRSHTCGELNLSNLGEEVTLCGWIQYQRYGKFLLLRDWHGLTQVTVSNIEDESICKMSFESILEVNGQVQARPQGQENKKMSTGDIEVVIKEMKILNPCRMQLPFEIKDFYKVKEQLRMEYRYLDLRQKIMQRNLRLRSQIVMKMREFLSNEHSFVDVETPTLFRKTPGGAQEFIVPSQIEGEFYSLPQSPQQFKQLLMVGGIDRYYQIARCYRDEGAKPDRQPEFTQVDIEMSFVNQDNIMKLVEDLLTSCWPFKQLTTPFPRYTYHQVMSTYGVDKPDTRFDMKIQDVTDILSGRIEIFKNVQSQNKTIQIISIPKAASLLSNTEIQKMIKSCCDVTYHLPVLPLKYNMDKIWSPNITNVLNEEDLHQIQQTCDTQPDDVMFLTSGTDFQPHTVLGKIRLKMADLLEAKGLNIRDAEEFNFLWVYDFPLFLPKEDGTGGIESAHHPFTAPDHKDIELIYTDPLQVKGQHYDLVLNGNEIGGGSIRNHQAELQKYILQHILKEDTSQLNHLLEALDAGCPPHGGIALGLDRLMAIVCNASSIRDVIAFPKSSEGRDLMSGAPSKISHEELDLYHIQIKEN